MSGLCDCWAKVEEFVLLLVVLVWWWWRELDDGSRWWEEERIKEWPIFLRLVLLISQHGMPWKTFLGRKIRYISSEIEDQIGVMMTSYPCSSFDMCCSLSLSLTLSLSLKWVNAAWYKYIQNRLLNSYIENQIVTSIISYPTIKKFIIVKKKGNKI